MKPAIRPSTPNRCSMKRTSSPTTVDTSAHWASGQRRSQATASEERTVGAPPPRRCRAPATRAAAKNTPTKETSSSAAAYSTTATGVTCPAWSWMTAAGSASTPSTTSAIRPEAMGSSTSSLSRRSSPQLRNPSCQPT
jgi:hypothetical protein